jgi:hypothetical protein
MKRMKPTDLAALALTLIVQGAAAQTLTDTDRKESEAPPPPAFNTKQLIPIDMPKYVTLRFGVDPATLSITPDGIVLYVVVAINPAGSINAMYEGIRCATGEVKTFARYTTGGKWAVAANPEWQSLEANLPSRHAVALARQGLCEGHSAATRSVPAMIKLLISTNQDRSLF